LLEVELVVEISFAYSLLTAKPSKFSFEAKLAEILLR
jgi:hypothetical protein